MPFMNVNGSPNLEHSLELWSCTLADYPKYKNKHGRNFSPTVINETNGK